MKKLATIVALCCCALSLFGQVHLYKKGTPYQSGDFKDLSQGWIMLYQIDEDKIISNAFKVKGIEKIVVVDSANYKAIIESGHDTSIFTFNITRKYNPQSAKPGKNTHANSSFFAVSRPQLDNIKPGSYKVVVNSTLVPAQAYEAIINHLFNHQLSTDKSETGKFIATSTIEPPIHIGFIRYEIFIKATSTGSEVAIVPFTKISPEMNSITFGTGVTEWEKMRGVRGMFDSVYGFAWRGAVSIAQQLDGETKFTD